MKKIIILCAALMIVLGGSGFAADYTKTGSVGAQFLKIAVGSRYQGLGEASVAVVDDASVPVASGLEVLPHSESLLDAVEPDVRNAAHAPVNGSYAPNLLGFGDPRDGQKKAREVTSLAG